MIKVGIVGGAGYTAGELIRLLVNHSDVEISFIHSTSHAGCPITQVHEGLYGDTDLTFTDELPLAAIDCLFICSGHGKSKEFMASHQIPEKLKIVDFSQDYRLETEKNKFVYGLPELNKDAIAAAQYIANPGCFATCIQLGLLPLAANNLLAGDIIVNAITGSTGAGVKPGETTHFSWRDNNLSIYKPFVHQHLPEIKQSIAQLQNTFDSDIIFVPFRGDFPRGIFASIIVNCNEDVEELYRLYDSFYQTSPFVYPIRTNIDLKQVVNTNKCLIHLERHGGKLLIASCIDNLLKGASGTAVQNMNLLFGLPETEGLKLKPSAF
ncbi:MAG: N-acetyl-gamma-glutamyl-phosphate reductase [Bacteroidales bacterium]|nr:N-acetyl-gamma-glutamyl-phosphate reductase [Bacteroidales bacterium]